MNSYEAYKCFLALKRHFTVESYDYFLYNGKINTTVSAFEKRKDKYHFVKLSNEKDPFGLVLSNLIETPELWVGDLQTDQAQSHYKRWIRVRDSLSRSFKQDLSQLDPVFNNNFIALNGNLPYVIKQYKANRISIETLTILESIVRFFPKARKTVPDILIADINNIVVKYDPFIKYDREVYKQAILSHFT